MASSQWWFQPRHMLSSPSKTIDHIPLSDELKKRDDAVQFILRVGGSLRLKMNVLSTAVTYLHRFYMRYSLGPSGYDKIYMAGACLFVATKVEESTRKLKDVAQLCYAKTASHGGSLSADDPNVQTWVSKILANEEILLEALCFDLIVEHPHQYLAEALGGGTRDSSDRRIQGPLMKCVSRTAMELSWSIANDSLRLPLCLFYQPNVIAAACYLLAFATDTIFHDNSRPSGLDQSAHGNGDVQPPDTISEFAHVPSDDVTSETRHVPEEASSQLSTAPPSPILLVPTPPQSDVHLLDDLLRDENKAAGPWMKCFSIAPDDISNVADILGNLVDFYEGRTEEHVREISKVPRPRNYHPLKDRPPGTSPASATIHGSGSQSFTSNSSPANTLTSETTPIHRQVVEEGGSSDNPGRAAASQGSIGRAPKTPADSENAGVASDKKPTDPQDDTHRDAKRHREGDSETAMDLDD